MQQTHFGERPAYTDQVDIWSLGVIVFSIMSGRMPFKRKPSDCVPLEDKESREYRKSFGKEPWPSISDSAKDFVERLLDPEPEDRLTAAEALQHPFLIKHAKSLQQKRMSLGGSKLQLKKQESQALTRITQFARTDALQKAAMLLIAHELHQDEIEQLRTIFYRLDADDDGEITWREMKAGFLELDSTAPEDVHALFAAFTEEGGQESSMDEDEVIPYSYFLAATFDHHILRSTDRLKEAFHQFDPDDTGFVDLHQVMDLLDDHGGRKHGPNVTTLKRQLSATSNDLANEKTEEVDTRHVTFEEFVRAIEAFQTESKDDFEGHMVARSDAENHTKKFVAAKKSKDDAVVDSVSVAAVVG
jgi:calcium-dependent protein kinase